MSSTTRSDQNRPHGTGCVHGRFAIRHLVSRCLATLPGRWFGKRQCGGGQAYLPHRLADCLGRLSGLDGKAPSRAALRARSPSRTVAVVSELGTVREVGPGSRNGWVQVPSRRCRHTSASGAR
jgi:hypothetical protein